MKVTYNWLKDFVDIKITPQKLAEKLTMAGLEVVSLEEKEGDAIFEIEITSNRPDWLSVLGIAREIAAITGTKIKDTKTPRLKIKNLPGVALKIEIENKSNCPLYAAKVIHGVKVGPAPEWMRKRLELIGCRSVNIVVDITNYVLFETGQPLHAFDLDKISGGTIFVRLAKTGERLITIDAQEKNLNPEMLVIADREKVAALAGVMGGKNTEVTGLTRNILLEAAVFDPVLIRRSRKSAVLDSDSSYRFERGVDIAVVESSSLRAAALIEELASGKTVLEKSSTRISLKEKTVIVDVDKVARVLGESVALSRIKQILKPLGFKIKTEKKGKITVTVPSFRRDIVLEEDIIEEISRVYGFELIKQSLPSVRPQVSVDKTRNLVSFIKNILVGLGVNEAITYSLIDRQLLKNFNIEDYSCVQILNPLSKEQEILRPGLIPSLSRVVAYNLNQKQDYVNIFEVAKKFINCPKEPKEELMLALATCGVRRIFLNQGQVKDEVGLLNLKGSLETVFKKLGVKEYSFEAQGKEVAVLVNKVRIGLLMQLEKGVLERMNIKNRDVFAAEISLENLFLHIDLDKKFEPLPRYPAVTRDISFIMKEDISTGSLINSMHEKGGALLRTLEVVEYYRGKQIPPGFRGLTLSCLYRSDGRTLTESEVNPVHAEVLGMLTSRFGVKTR